MLKSTATLLADRGPNPDLRSGKFRPQPTIGPKFGPLHFFWKGTHCLPYACRARNPSNRGEDLFFCGLQSAFGRQLR